MAADTPAEDPVSDPGTLFCHDFVSVRLRAGVLAPGRIIAVPSNETVRVQIYDAEGPTTDSVEAHVSEVELHAEGRLSVLDGAKTEDT